MKSLTGLVLLLVKLYCGFKIFQWLYLQSVDRVNHPITEIQHILVFLIFDIWMMSSVNQIKDDLENPMV